MFALSLNLYLTPSLLIFQAYQKGASPKYHVLPAGGKVLTSEEDYNLLSDKHFPDPIGKPCLKPKCQTRALVLMQSSSGQAFRLDCKTGQQKMHAVLFLSQSTAPERSYAEDAIS